MNAVSGSSQTPTQPPVRRDDWGCVIRLLAMECRDYGYTTRTYRPVAVIRPVVHAVALEAAMADHALADGAIGLWLIIDGRHLLLYPHQYDGLCMAGRGNHLQTTGDCGGVLSRLVGSPPRGNGSARSRFWIALSPTNSVSTDALTRECSSGVGGRLYFGLTPRRSMGAGSESATAQE